MTDKELKQLSRSELLELLIAQMEENESLRNRLEKAEAELQSRHIQLDKAGSIAEAALLLNGVFQSAEEAAKQYLDNIRDLSGRQEEICRQLEAQAQENANAIMEEAEKYSVRVRSRANDYCRTIISRVRNEYEKQDEFEEYNETYET